MIRSGSLALLSALVVFIIYFANVAFGAAGQGVFLGDVAEMLTLFVAVVLFVIGVLARETVAKKSDGST